MARKADLRFADHGSLWILCPETRKGRAWMRDNLPSDAMTWGPGGIVIEPRYVSDIAQGAENDGLTVRL